MYVLILEQGLLVSLLVDLHVIDERVGHLELHEGIEGDADHIPSALEDSKRVKTVGSSGRLPRHVPNRASQVFVALTAHEL